MELKIQMFPYVNLLVKKSTVVCAKGTPNRLAAFCVVVVMNINIPKQFYP